jgi:hypothetical protein
MTAEIIKLPYSVTRGAHSRKPRRSKNGTPEERAALRPAPADIVPLSLVRAVAPPLEVDRRKLRGSPLRNYVHVIALGATVVGKMHTAGLKGEPLVMLPPETRNDWLETLAGAGEALATVGSGLDQAIQTLKALQSETSDFPVNLPVPNLGQPVLNLAIERDQ